MSTKLTELARRQGISTVHLSVLRSGGIVIIDKVDSPHPVRVDTFVGLSAPARCSATGKAILTFEPPRFTSKAVRDRLLPALKRTGAAIESQIARTSR